MCELVVASRTHHVLFILEDSSRRVIEEMIKWSASGMRVRRERGWRECVGGIEEGGRGVERSGRRCVSL